MAFETYCFYRNPLTAIVNCVSNSQESMCVADQIATRSLCACCSKYLSNLFTKYVTWNGLPNKDKHKLNFYYPSQDSLVSPFLITIIISATDIWYQFNMFTVQQNKTPARTKYRTLTCLQCREGVAMVQRTLNVINIHIMISDQWIILCCYILAIFFRITGDIALMMPFPKLSRRGSISEGREIKRLTSTKKISLMSDLSLHGLPTPEMELLMENFLPMSSHCRLNSIPWCLVFLWNNFFCAVVCL